MEKLFEALFNAMDENSFMIEHEKKKVKESSKALKEIIKVNEVVEIRIDVAPYIKEREDHLKQLSQYKEQQRKLNRIFKILNKDTEE